MGRAMNWERAAKRDLVRDRGPYDAPAARRRGISNEQAKKLAGLQRRAGEAYTGAGLTAQQAAREIRRLS